MPATLIVQLLATFGPSAVQLITTLIAKWQTNASVTPQEWADLIASAQLNSTVHMTAQLQAAGIDPTSAQGVAFLKLVAPPASK